MQNPFLTVREACEVLRCSPDTLYRELKAGNIPGAFRLGRTWRIDRAALLGIASNTEKRRTADRED